MTVQSWRQTRRTGAAWRLAALINASCLVALAAGCGDSQETRGGPNASQVSTGLDRAAAGIADFREQPTAIGPSEPLPSLPSGKSVVYLECSIVNCTEHAVALKEAFGALDIDFTTIDAGLSPETFADAFEAAEQMAPDAVIYDGIPASIAQRYVDALSKDGVVVIGIASPDVKTGDNVFYAQSPEFYRRMGQILADWTTVDSDGEATLVYVKDPTLAFGVPEFEGFSEAIKENCPDCKVDTLETNSGAIGTTFPGELVAYLQKNPDITHVVTQYSALLIGVPAALGTSGLAVRTVGFGPTKINQQALKDGQESADILQSNEALPWGAADIVARRLVGVEVDRELAANPPIVQLAETRDVTWDPNDSDWPYLDGWKQDFIDLWNGEG
jgi:ribose transport system substrate-binding protein